MMKFFITKKKLVKKLAEELAYLQIMADYWCYIMKDEDMPDFFLQKVTEFRCICFNLGIIKEVYDEALKIYDFRNSGKKDFVPDIYYIEKMEKEFCEPRRKGRPIL